MKIIQYLPYSYHIHNGWVEKIAQTLSDGLNADTTIEVLNIASTISNKNNHNHLVTKTDTLFIPSFDLIHNFPLPKIWKKDFRNQFNIIKKYKPDIIITHTRFFVQSMIWGMIAKRLWSKRIHIEHGSGFVTGYPWYIKIAAWLFDRTIGLWIFRQCDQIVTISQMHKNFISRFTKKEPLVIYNPIDYQPHDKIRNTIPHIGFVGRLVSLKWVGLLIQTLKQIENKQRSCTIVGTGSEDEKLKNLTHTLGLSDRVRFVWADDRSNRLHTFDIFVNPSHQEWLPTTVVEALMAKCIVVATDVWGTKEISDQEDLIIIQSWNIDLLNVWIKKAFDNLEKSEKSYEKVMERFWVEGAIEKYKRIMIKK
jgi:glycosyltransferase involved in cell wall biosynthesis